MLKRAKRNLGDVVSLGPRGLRLAWGSGLWVKRWGRETVRRRVKEAEVGTLPPSLTVSPGIARSPSVVLLGFGSSVAAKFLGVLGFAVAGPRAGPSTLLSHGDLRPRA